LNKKLCFDVVNGLLTSIYKMTEYSKEWIKEFFRFKIFADNRDDNMGNSNVIRYRKDPIVFNGRNIYITTQWFEDNRNDVISWYRKHL